MRVEPGKKALIILDHVGNSWKFGLPDDIREWTLEGRKKKKGKSEPTGPQLRHCDNCLAIFRAPLANCPNCGKQYLVEGRLPDEEEGELKEIAAEQHRLHRRREEGMTKGLEALVALAKERGYKPGWAGARHAARQGHKPGSREFYKAIAEARRIFQNGGSA